jgi:hypothetical protein
MCDLTIPKSAESLAAFDANLTLLHSRCVHADNDNISTRCGSGRSARSIAMNDVRAVRCGGGGAVRALACGHPRAPRRAVWSASPRTPPLALYAN